MCVTTKDLVIWSLVAASAHGAGLMVLPFVLDVPAVAHPSRGGQSSVAFMFATVLHTDSYLTVAGGIAWVVYRKAGLRLLRHVWINVNVLNVNVLWAVALIVTALATLAR